MIKVVYSCSTET